MKNKKMIITMIVAIASILLGYISDKYNVKLLQYFAVLLPVIYSIFLSPSHNLCLFCILLTSNRLLTVNSISVLLMLMIIGLFKIKTGIKIPPCFIIATLILLLIPVLYPIEIMRSILLIIKIIVMLLYFYNILESIDVNVLRKDYINYIFWGIIITFIFSIIINPLIIKESNRFALTNDGGENFLGILCGLIAIIIICNMITKIEMKMPIFKVIVLLLIGFLTGSRSFLLSIAIGVIIIIIYELTHLQFQKTIKFFLILIVLGLLAYVLIKKVPILTHFYESFLHRVQKLSDGDISNGRYELWNKYYTVFRNNKLILFFGYPNYESYGIKYAAHNFLIEQIATNGIIGNLIIGFLYFKTIRHILKNRKIVFNSYTSVILAFSAISMVSHSWFGIFQSTILLFGLLFSTEAKEVK